MAGLTTWLDAQRYRPAGSITVARLAKGLPFDCSRSLRHAIGHAARLYHIETGESVDLVTIERNYFARLDAAKRYGAF